MRVRTRSLLVAAVFSICAARARAQAPPLADEFRVNDYTTGFEGRPVVASAGDGSFVVAWARGGAAGTGIFARRYDAHGAPKATGFQVNTGTAVPGQYPSIAADASGGFVVVWGDADGYNSHARRFDAAGAPVGSQLGLPRALPKVASDATGNFVVVGSEYHPGAPFRPPFPANFFGRRFDATGAPAGSEFLVSGFTDQSDSENYIVDYPADRAVGMAPRGSFTVVWALAEMSVLQGAGPFRTADLGVFGRRFATTGETLGPIFPVTTSSATHPRQPAIAVDPLGNFLVVWSSVGQNDAGRGIRGQRFDASGEKVGPEFQVNTYTTGDQTSPSVAVDEAGDFVVVWSSAGQDGSSDGVFGARFDRHGTRLGGEFQVNAHTTGDQQAPQVASDGRGMVAVWQSDGQDGSDFGVFGRRQNLHAETFTVDGASKTGTTGDANGVLEPGERALVVPAWSNETADPIDLTATASLAACSPGSACVEAKDASADYGTIPADASADCDDGAPDACYQISATGPRPGTHWDAELTENLSGGGSRVWPLHVGDSFTDVPRSQPFYRKIETLLHTGITSGCTPTAYCPASIVSRDQMAIFIAKGIAGLGELVPTAGLVGANAYDCASGGVSLFTDVAPTDAFCKHVHYLAAQNVTLGCTVTTYCPGQSVTRDAMASFIAKAVVAPGGGAAIPTTYSDPNTGLSYSCDAGSPNVHFTDVPVSNPFCRHIHYLWARGMVSGCSATQYCPTGTVARDAMAKFLANAFGLQLYGTSVKPPITVSNGAPVVSAGSDQTVTQTGGSTAVALSGSASDDGVPDPPGALTIHWSQISGPAVTFDDASAAATTAHFPQAALYVLRLTASDGALSSTSDVTINVNPTGGVPPDPKTLAPPLDPSAPGDLGDTTTFLYTGPNPIQTGVAGGTIEPHRAAVVRGKVQLRGGGPVSGVKITVLAHPELGQTLSRADGVFDMAVNGGAMLTFRYEKAGLLPAQRQVKVPWADFAFAPDVTLVTADSRVTLIDLTSALPFQMARSNPVTDADGTRQATLLFAAGTTAGLVQPDGSLVPTAQLHVRLTEYTVGPAGPNSMPGDLPPTSQYTYATELGADEAVAKVDGRDVVFNKPVLLYVENLTNVPVGQAVPVGYYDPARSTWIGAPNGRVVKVLGKTAGLADLDVNGDGVADTGAALTALGITDPERGQLATLYAAGTSLWRTPLDHFSTVDCNWNATCNGGCGSPNEPPPPPPKSCQNNSKGSIIGCERQTLGEDVAIAGTPFQLHYESDRVPGRIAEGTLLLPLATKGVPDGVQNIQLQVMVAGQKITQSFDPATSTTNVTWDGKDAYGRTAVGSQRVTVRVGYTYKMTPASAAAAAVSWAKLSGIPMSGSRARGDLTLWQESTQTIIRADGRTQGLGGWTLSALHAYDPVGRVIHFGDGTRRDASSVSAGPIPAGVISTIAGKTPGGFAGDNGPAIDARFRYPYGLAVGPDGSLYIADSQNHRVRRIDAAGIITTVAGNGTPGFAGDNADATAAQLNTPYGVALGPDGSLFIVDQFNYRVRKVRPDGKIVTIAGNGSSTYGGDGGPATSAGMQPWGVAVGPDGAVYIADRSNSRLRMVDQNGIISTVAGNGLAGPNADGVPATTVNLGVPSDVALGPDGSLYIVVGGPGRIRKVTPQGIISTIAGTTAGFSGDGGPANLAQIDSPVRLAVGPDGSIYIPDTGNQRLRWIGTEGIITTIAGKGTAAFSGDGGLATQAQFNDPYAVAVGPDGSVYVADSFNQRIRKIASALPGGSVSDLLLASSDGSELYVFSGAGRHKKTLDALTGAVRAQFAYDSENRLLSVDDGDGNVTSIERDGTTGDPTAIVAPFGQRTELTLDGNGYLSAIKNPANETVNLVTSATGLLTQLTDPRGGIHKFTYGGLGRLNKDEDPAGGVQTLARTETPTGTTVTVTTKLGRTTTYVYERLATGAVRSAVTDPSGLTMELLLNPDGSQKTTRPDGTVDVVVPGADPRFGLQAPILASFTRSTPGGVVETGAATRTATLSDPNDPLSLQTQTDTFAVNGKTWTTAYQASSNTVVSTTPVGRKLTRTLNARGRVVAQQVSGLSAENFTYDAHGRLLSDVQGTRTTSFAYDSDGLLHTRTDPLGRVSTFAYDAVGRITSETLPGPRTIAFAYDASGNPTSITPPVGAAHALAYTPIDLDASYAPPPLPGGPTPTSWTHDVDRNLTKVTRPDASHVDLAYDTGGRLSSVTFPGGALGYTYDTKGRTSAISAPTAENLSYTYDGDLLTGAAASGPVSGSVGATYDTSFRVASLTVNGANAVNFAYDADGLTTAAGSLALTWGAQTGLLSGSTLGVVTDTWTYSAFGEATAYTASANGSPVFGEAYVRDALGRVTTRSETIGGTTDTYDYAYDAAGRLIQVKKNGSVIETHVYDANGNRTSFTGNAGTQVAVYDAQDRLTSFLGNTYSYTSAGELLAKNGASGITTYDYDALGNLRSVALPGGPSVAYVTDGLQRRVGKKVNGTLVKGFLYQDGLRPVAELDGAGAVVSRFVYDSTSDNVPAYMVKGGVTYRIVTDRLGSVRLVVNAATGAIVQRMDYEAFGKVLADTSPGFQPFGFAGGLYDTDTKLVRFGARDYDPEAGRWTAKDPILLDGGQTNLYAYVGNDPVNDQDEDGLKGKGGGGRGKIIEIRQPKKDPPKPPKPPDPPAPPPPPPAPPPSPPCPTPQGPPQNKPKLQSFDEAQKKNEKPKYPGIDGLTPNLH